MRGGFPVDDRQILRLLWERMEEAITALAQKFGRGLHALAMNILNSRPDAEEAVNDTYLALWNAIPPERPDPLTPYVYRVGRNTALKKLRYNTAQKRCSDYTLSLDELAESLPGGTVEETLDAKVLGQAIDRYLSTLSAANRMLFMRRYWYGDPVKEIAAGFGMCPDTVSVRLNRLRAGLRDYLYKEGILE